MTLHSAPTSPSSSREPPSPRTKRPTSTGPEHLSFADQVSALTINTDVAMSFAATGPFGRAPPRATSQAATTAVSLPRTIPREAPFEEPLSAAQPTPNHDTPPPIVRATAALQEVHRTPGTAPARPATHLQTAIAVGSCDALAELEPRVDRGCPLTSASPSSALVRARESAVYVALHATESGLRVYARVGRMDATERERLRDAVAALLAEHGFSHAAVTMSGNGDDTSGKQGDK